MTLYEKLLKIQAELHAPKGQYNTFGKYKYRSCEDILEAVKPLNSKYGMCLTLTDDIVTVNDRYYVKASANLIDTASKNESKITVTAYAREEETKKGMDGSQITGASSSYARKYALNGLYNIDDTKDSDSTNTRGGEEKTEVNYRQILLTKLREKNIDINSFAKENGLNKDTTKEKYKELVEGLK